eukprot:CAMPEP_0185157904 /NCGR_PEP_ID=MMETSP1139-20130426/2073_1 /TAXON_ID=298111 /ORGANISM="Pavlova sp., Strain CCMP459" /LENGTH=1133 /DNA_ID=CAMNT_0027723009 /DNA_START=12 /DNA_END=3413 /DNA_ORIENTATION=+
MLKDKITPQSISDETGVPVEVIENELMPPKRAQSAFLVFCSVHRADVAQQVPAGSGPGEVQRVLGERWHAVSPEEKAECEAAAEKDRERYEQQMARYEKRLEAEAAAEEARKNADGPSLRDVERAEKRARVEKEAEERAAVPKAVRQVKERTQEEKKLDRQNKQIEADKKASAEARLRYLFSQSDLFEHFGFTADLAPHRGRGASKKSASKERRRMTEKEEDDQLLAREGGTGADATAKGFGESVRITEQPRIINKNHGNMRAYQIAGLNWLANLYLSGINGILADEMGLGKTLQCISLLAWLKSEQNLTGPYLVIAPKSTLTNWEREFSNWCPELKTMLFHGNKEEREELIRTKLQPDQFEVVVTSYEMVTRESTAFKKFSWRYIIVDEAHRMKNEESVLSQVLRSLSSHSRLLITGTPLQNNLHELWALLNFLLPDIFSSAEQWREWFDLDDKEVEEEVIHKLHRVLRPFLLRRVKGEVEGDLPPKKEMLLSLGLTDMQREQYKNILKRDIDALYNSSGPQLGANKSRLLNIVMQLRKCCNHPYLFEGAEDKTLPPYGEHLITNSGKMILLDRLLKRLQEQGSRVLIFSQMTRQLDILEDYCNTREFSYCRIDGNTGGEERQDMIDAFNQPGSKVFVFLLSTRAGGLGINLQTADTVILYDSDWNPQADLQAQDRAHRIGQKKQVNVYRLMVADSIEEKMIERAELKLRMDAAVIQSGRLAEKSKSMSKEDAIQAIRYGADKIFKASETGVTDDDIDMILSRGKDLTTERSQLTEKEKKSLLDFSSADFAYQQFEGEDYTKARENKQDDMEFLARMSESMGKRERGPAIYSEREVRTFGQAAAQPAASKMPKMRKMPDMKDFQLYRATRIQELFVKEHEAELARARRVAQGAADTGGDEGLLPPEEEEERRQLLDEGFPAWTRGDYNRFIRATERHGRNDVDKIAREMDGKTLQEVTAYRDAFFSRGPELLADWERIERKIQDGERKLAVREEMQAALREKVSRYDNPWQQLSLKYGTSRGKIFNEDEDRFLLCMTNKLGYGQWDELKREIRRSPEFRFDWIFKSRTPQELSRRVDLLIRLVVNEAKERDGVATGRGAGAKRPADQTGTTANGPEAKQAKSENEGLPASDK